ncbi:MAG: hypothetical protein LC720_08275, partial [Actinobacteria bacterium]|nr:hypothetical protein [Actinomycetota bacterium]
TLRFPRAGTSLVRVRFSPYWQVSRGCVARASGGYTQVTVRDPGLVRVTIGFSLGRLVDPDPRCAAVPRPPARVSPPQAGG